MKTAHKIILLSLSVAAGIAIAAQQTINIGTVANDGNGEGIRDAFDKVNDNFTELYASGGSTLIATSGSTTPTIDDSVAETTVFTCTVPGGTLGTSNSVLVRLGGLVSNDSGAGRGFTVAVKYGGTTLYAESSSATAITNSSVLRPWTMEFVLSAADSSASVQRMIGTFGPVGSASAPTTGYGDMGAGGNMSVYAIAGSSAVNSAVDQTLEVTITLTFAHANYEWTTLKASAWKL